MSKRSEASLPEVVDALELSSLSTGEASWLASGLLPMGPEELK